MIASDPHDQIVQLEAEIERLAKKLETCRKVMLFSKLATGAGLIWILAYLLGAFGSDPANLIGGIGAMIGGIVLLGSNSTTAKTTTTAMKDVEKRRVELVDSINARTVGCDRTIH